jgi:hypothetical protein
VNHLHIFKSGRKCHSMSGLSLLLECRLFLFVKGGCVYGVPHFSFKVTKWTTSRFYLFIYFFRVGLIMGIAELHIKKEMILDFNKILFPQLSWLFPYVFERFGF